MISKITEKYNKIIKRTGLY